MKTTLISAAALALVLAAGCKNNQTTEPAKVASDNSSNATNVASTVPSSMTPEELGALGAQIKKQPNQADQLLSQHGLNSQSFAAAIRKVSEKPDDAKRYTAAYKRAS
jgi:hypothetical protein